MALGRVDCGRGGIVRIARDRLFAPAAVATFASLATLLLIGCGDRRETDVLLTDAGSAADAPAADAEEPGLALQFIDPDHGPFTGGTEILVRGHAFTSSTEVRVGGRSVDPIHLDFIDSRRIRILTPPGEPGLADVEVIEGGESAALPQAFVYESIYVDPPAGSVAGSTFVTITGLGTDFEEPLSVTFDGLPLTSVTVVNDQVLTGLTPPGIPGAADVVVATATGQHVARRAYTYLTTADPFFGGMSGGAIAGTVNVVVVDGFTKNGVPDAYVVVGDPETSPYQGYTDFFGQITFSGPDLAGPVTTTAAAEGYETTSFVEYDAENLTIFLNGPPPPPNPGPLPPGPQLGRVQGHVLFGDSTALGSPVWNLVPEPRTPTERKRIYVTTTAPSIFSSPLSPSPPIDYQGYDPQVTAWSFEVFARPSALAIVAIAGLYDPAKDPSGAGATGFEPFAMGLARGVLVGPGEIVSGVDVVVNIPLDTAVRVDLDLPPALATPGWNGPAYYMIRPFIDLGGEGAIAMNKHGLGVGPGEDRPNTYPFADGEESIVLSRMAPLAAAISDASYSFVVSALSPGDSNPFSIRIARGVKPVNVPVELGDFLGTPRPVDPAPGELATARVAVFDPDPPSDGEATFNLHVFTSLTGAPLLRVFARGPLFFAPIPDVTFGGLPPFPSDEDVAWTFYRIQIQGMSFDQFTYRQLSSMYWSAYAADAHIVQFP